jgi:hypothetical protein
MVRSKSPAGTIGTGVAVGGSVAVGGTAVGGTAVGATSATGDEQAAIMIISTVKPTIPTFLNTIANIFVSP